MTFLKFLLVVSFFVLNTQVHASNDFSAVNYRSENLVVVQKGNKELLKIKGFPGMLSAPHQQSGCYANGAVAVGKNAVKVSEDGQIAIVIFQMKGWYKYNSRSFALITFDAGQNWHLENLLEQPASHITDCDWINLGIPSNETDRVSQVNMNAIQIFKNEIYIPVNANYQTTFVSCCDHRANYPKNDNLVIKFNQVDPVVGANSSCPSNVTEVNSSCSIGLIGKEVVFKREYQNNGQRKSIIGSKIDPRYQTFELQYDTKEVFSIKN